MVQRGGFTLIEMLLVVIIGAVLMGVGSREYGRIAAGMAAENARDALIHTAFRARSEAMRSGHLVYLRVRPGTGLVRVEDASATVLHEMDAATWGTTLVGADTDVCYAARGYALPGCTTVTTATTVSFTRGTDTARAVILPLGQVRRDE